MNKQNNNEKQESAHDWANDQAQGAEGFPAASCSGPNDQTVLDAGQNPIIGRFSYSLRAGQEVLRDLKAEVEISITDQEFAWLSERNLLVLEEGIPHPIYQVSQLQSEHR